MRLDLRNSKDVRDAFVAIETKLTQLGKRDQMQGVTVQPMIREGIETIVGMTRDPSFGRYPVRSGGVQVELLKDVALRVNPLTDKDASEMVRAIRGAKLLDGYRGAPPGDVAKLEEVILRLSQLVGEFPGSRRWISTRSGAGAGQGAASRSTRACSCARRRP